MTGHVVVASRYQEVVARGRAVKLRLSPGRGGSTTSNVDVPMGSQWP